MNDVIIASNSNIDWSIVFSGITALATIVSVFILAFYTYFTRKMQQAIERQVNEQSSQTKEFIHQRRLGIMPSILVEISEGHLQVRNIGNGTALNVNFENSIINEKLYSDDFSYKIEKIIMLAPKQTKEVKIHNESVVELPMNWTGLRVAGEIIFQDIEGNSYQQTLENLDQTGEFRYGFPVMIDKTKK